MSERLYESPRIFCRGTQYSGGRTGFSGRSPDRWNPGIPILGTSVDAQGTRVGGDGEPHRCPQPIDPAEWLRVEAAVVLGGLCPVPPLRVMKVNVEFALVWIDVANRPEVLDLGRVLVSEGGGDASCSWSHVQRCEDQSVCLLSVMLHRPVRAAFAIPFSFPDMQRLLIGLLQAKALVLLFDTPPEGIAGSESAVDVRALYELAISPSREMISIEFDRAAHDDLEGTLLRWARWDMWGI